MQNNETPRTAFCLLVEGREEVSGEYLQFFQTIVLYAHDAQDAERRVANLLERQGAQLVSVDPSETREVTPDSVQLGNAIPHEGVIGCTGRIWVKPGLFQKMSSKLRKLWH